MGSLKKTHSLSSTMKATLVLLIITILINLSNTLFFQKFSRPASTCRRNFDCRSRKCLSFSNGLCDLANLFRGRKENCSYRKCAQCTNDSHCSRNQECRNNFCYDPTAVARVTSNAAAAAAINQATNSHQATNHASIHQAHASAVATHQAHIATHQAHQASAVATHQAHHASGVATAMGAH